MEGKESLSQSEFWEKELAEWRSSGLSALEYCRLKGLGRHKFFYWKKKLSKAPESVEFIEIPRVKADHKTKENKRPDLIIRKGQFAVEISPRFDPASLETVLKVIGGLCSAISSQRGYGLRQDIRTCASRLTASGLLSKEA